MENVINSELGSRRAINLWRQLDHGKSSASVFFADIDADSYQGHAVLKLDVVTAWSNTGEREYRRHQQAVDAEPAFGISHLPKLILAKEHEGKLAILYNIAGGDYTNIQPFTRLGLRQQKVMIQRIARDILAEWNKDYRLSEEARHPKSILEDWLGYRLDPVQGKIADFLESRCKLEFDTGAFSFNGDWLPNPYAYARSADFWKKSRRMFFVKGRIHGDLHGLNILVKVKGRGESDYFLIDLSLCNENAYLFYDHAYLELSYLLHEFKNCSLSGWIRILKALYDFKSGKARDDDVLASEKGALEVIGCSRGEISKWIDDHQAERKPDIEGQAALARTAVGLNFCNKPMDDRRREFSFLYAATNLREYLDRFDLSWLKEGPSLRFEEQVEPPASDHWKVVWNAADSFDAAKNCYVLVSARVTQERVGKELSSLGRIPWSLVLDFDPESSEDGIL